MKVKDLVIGKTYGDPDMKGNRVIYVGLTNRNGRNTFFPNEHDFDAASKDDRGFIITDEQVGRCVEELS